MNRTLVFAIVACVLAAGCTQQGDVKPLTVLCGSSMTEPMQVLVKQFEKETGIPTELTLGGCETLFPALELGAPADLFIGHTPFEDMLKDKDLRQDELAQLGKIKPSIVVAKGNPKGINSLKDMTRDGVRVGLPDARYSTCGEMFEEAATNAQLLDSIKERTDYTARTHQELATALRTENVDVVVVWNFIAAMHTDYMDVVTVETDFPSVNVFGCVVKEPQSQENAQKFMDFLATQSTKDVFTEMGYGDSGSENAKSESVALKLFCAAGVKKPIDELVDMFTKENPGVTFQSIYQGSGTLLTQIELNKEGDLYIAGDEVYMDRAREKGLLQDSRRMAVFTPVLAVPKANPKQISQFADLAKDGVRLGLADKEAAAVGKVAVELLERKKLWDKTQKNVVVTTGTVNELAVQASVGSLDAVIIWDATANQFKDKLEAVARGDEQSQVGVPIAVLESSKHKDAASKFTEFATSDKAAAIFNKHGFETPKK